MTRTSVLGVACVLAVAGPAVSARAGGVAEDSKPRVVRVQATRSAEPTTRRAGRGNRPIVLGPDDKQVFPDPPAGFNLKREGIPHGGLEMIEYDSKTVGTKRKMQVYTPPGYSKQQ